MKVNVNLSGLKEQYNLSAKQVDLLTEQCVQAVTANIYRNWQDLAHKRLHSTLPEYLHNLHVVDKGRFAKQIVLTGVLPLMIERGADAFDIKEGFQRSNKVRYSVPVYNAKGKKIREGGDWYLTVPFRHGTPGIVGQAGFSNEMPQEIYSLMLKRDRGAALRASEIPSPYDVPSSRQAIVNEQGATLYAEYKHRSSIYEGLTKQSAAYNKVVQNTYMAFRRAGKNSDPMSWIHKGIKAYKLAEEAVKMCDVDLIIRNEVLEYLDNNL